MLRTYAFVALLALLALVSVSAASPAAPELSAFEGASATAALVQAHRPRLSMPMLRSQISVAQAGALQAAGGKKDKDKKKDDKKDDKKADKKAAKKGLGAPAPVPEADPLEKPIVYAGMTGSSPYSCSVAGLRPTQVAVGFRSVAAKRQNLRKKDKAGQLDAFLREKPIPVVTGPGGLSFLIDHHHLSRALREEKIKMGVCTQLADYEHLSVDEFWKQMAAKSWWYPKDELGQPITYHALPDSVAKLVNNEYRSVAGFVREQGGFSKTTIPFTEFFWADFYRPLIPMSTVTNNFDDAVKQAMALAHTPAAAKLPGYTAVVGAAAPVPAPAAAQADKKKKKKK